MIKLSIILPVYNVSNYICRCLDSICSQITNEIEIIIVDDESPDDSISKAKKYSNKYNQISIIAQENKGLGGARNTGLKHSSGKFVWFVDSDDEIKRDCLTFILKDIDSQDICIYDYEECDVNKAIIPKRRHPYKLQNCEGWEIEKHFIPSQAWTTIYKKQFLLENHLFFREKFLHEDGEFNMRVMVLAKNVSYTPYIIYRYYTHNSGSIMNSLSIRNQQDLLAYFNTAEQFKSAYSLLSLEQRTVINNHLRAALGVFFINATRLPTTDFKLFQKLLKTNKSMIWKFLLNDSFNAYNRFILFVELFFPYRFVYKLIYYKHF